MTHWYIRNRKEYCVDRAKQFADCPFTEALASANSEPLPGLWIFSPLLALYCEAPPPLYKEGDFHILVGGGVKRPKEGRCVSGDKSFFKNPRIPLNRRISTAICWGP